MKAQLEDLVSFLLGVILFSLTLWFAVQLSSSLRIKGVRIYMTTYRYGDMELKLNPPLYIIHTDNAYKTTPELLALAVASKSEEYEWYTQLWKRRVNVKQIVRGLYDKNLREIRNYEGKVIYRGKEIFKFGPGAKFEAKTIVIIPSIYNSADPYFNLTLVT